MSSSAKFISERSTPSGRTVAYSQAPPDSPSTSVLPLTRTRSAERPLLPEFATATSKMATGEESSNGLSIPMFNFSDSDSDEEPLDTISEEPAAPPAPPPSTTRTTSSAVDGASISRIHSDGPKEGSERAQMKNKDPLVSVHAVQVPTVVVQPDITVSDDPERIREGKVEEPSSAAIPEASGSTTKGIEIVESSSHYNKNELVIPDEPLFQTVSTSSVTTISSGANTPMMVSSSSCPKLSTRGNSLAPSKEVTQGKNQVLEYSFNFEHQESDLEGSDLEAPEQDEDEFETQMYGLTASSSMESLVPELGDVLSTTDSTIIASAEKLLEQKKRVKIDWVGIQKTTFTNWINDYLKPGKNDRKVEELSTDLKDGLLLIKLLENLTKKKVKGFSGKDPKTVHHERENLTLAFRFMRAESIKMVGIGPTNVSEGNLKLILGMIWMLIQQYHIRMIGYNISTKDAIIQWLEALLQGWKFTNLTTEWRDGRALIAVLNQVKHGIAPNVASLDPTKHRKNCTAALKAAYNHLKIPKIFTVDNLCDGRVDEESMMTYLSYFVSPYRDKLLRWARKVIPQFGITGFTSDWYNGQAFAALVDICFPGSVRYWPSPDSGKIIDTILRFALKNLGNTPPFTSLDLLNGLVEEIQVMSMVMMIKNGELNTLAEEVRLSGPGLKEAQLHKETSFIVSTAGAGPGELNIDAYYEKDGEKLKFSAKEKVKTEVHLKYTPKRLANIVFAITWSDTPVPFSPFVVAVFDSTLVQVEDFESHKRIVSVDKPIELIVDATRAGKGRLKAQLVYGKKDKFDAMITPISKGRYKLEHTPLKLGSASLHIWWNKTHLDHYHIMYTVITREDYAVDAYPSEKVFCTFDDVRFVVRSSLGLPLSVLQMTAIIDYEFQLPIRFNHVEGKKGYATFKPTAPGIYNVEVVCLDQFIEGSPFQVCVVDPLSFKILQDVPSHLKVGVPLVLEIDAKDVAARSMAFASPDVSVPSKFKTKFEQNGNNFVKAELTPLEEGDFMVGFKYHGHWISGSPFRIQICDPTKFSVATDLGVATAGKPIYFTVVAREANEGDMQLAFTAKGPNAQYSPRITLSDDGLQYHVTFIPWEIGSHTIGICYGNFHIQRSPITVPVIALDPTTCSATGMGLQRAITKVPAQFTVLGKGPKWVENGTLFIRIMSVVTKEECRVRIRDNNDCTYGVAYLVENPGAYLLEIKTAGEHIPGSPFRLNAIQGPDASKVKLFGPALKEGAVLTFGKPIAFSVNTKDAGNGKLLVKAVGPESANARVFVANSDKGGEYDIDVDVLRHGKHRVIVKWSGKHVPNSPFILKVFPGADASKCIAKGPGLEDGVIGNMTSFTIDTKYAGAGLLKVRLHGLKGAFKIKIKPVDGKNRRVLLANYDPKFPGEYLIKILWCDVHVPGSPFRVKIIGNAPSMPEVFTPTPRLPELGSSTNFLEEEDSGGSSDHLRSRFVSAPNILDPDKQVIFSKQKNATNKKSRLVRSVATRSMRVPKKKKKGEFDGQLTVRMKTKTKSKFAK